MPFIDAHGIRKSYRTGESTRQVLDDLEASFEMGEFALILGPSGSGKTTLLNILGGIDRTDDGELIIDGRNLSKASDDEMREYRRTDVGFIFQFYNLMPNLNVRENVELACEVMGWDRKKVSRESERYLKAVGLDDKMEKLPQQLSGGEQQRVAIARALAKHPKVIFGDEPTGNLDEDTGLMIIELLKEVNERYNTTMIIVSHDPALRDYARRILQLRRGTLREM